MLERRTTDVLAVQLNVDSKVGTSISLQSVLGTVGTVTVVHGLRLDLGVTVTGNTDLEPVTTVGLVLSLLVLSLNGDGVAHAGVVSISTLEDVDGLGGVLDSVTIQSGGDGVLSGLINIVLNIVGTISVIGDLGVGGAGAGNLDLTVVTGDGVIVDITSEDLEVSGLVIEGTFQTGSLSPGLGGIGGGLDVGLEGSVLDVITVELDANVIVSRSINVVDSVDGSVTVVLEGGLNGSVGAVDVDLIRLTSVSGGVTVSIDTVDGEGKITAGLTAGKTGSISPGVLGAGTLHHNVEGRTDNVLTLKLDGNLVATSLLGSVAGLVVTVLKVLEGSGSDLLRSSDLDLEPISLASDLGGVTLDVLSTDEEGVLLASTASLNTRSVSGGAGSDGGSLALGILLKVVTEVRDVGHDGVFIRCLVNIDGINKRVDVIFVLGDLDGTGQIVNGVSLGVGTIKRAVSGVQRIAKSGKNLTVDPGASEVLGLFNTIRLDLLLDPLEEEPLGGSLLNTGLDLVTENQGPDQTQDNTQVSLKNIRGTDVDKLQTLKFDEFESSVQVLLLNNSVSRLGPPLLGHLLAGDDFQKVDEEDTIAQISLDIVDGHHTLGEVLVHPSGESLKFFKKEREEKRKEKKEKKKEEK